MATPYFDGNFTQQEAIPDAAIKAAEEVLRSGRLHRYNLAPDEFGETAYLEKEYAAWQGSKYCLALASCGQAIQIALRASGVMPGDQVLINAFTLAPAPGAIHAVGGIPTLVEIDENLRIYLDDLAQKADSSGAKYLLLSHMRGHICDMDRLMEIADRFDLKVIEDCAHTMGARWDGERSGNFGLAGCFSTQTYKHLNSGEGGLLTSNDPDFMARATVLSGSYMHFEKHGASPASKHFEAPCYEMGNMSARMDDLRAAILRPQLKLLKNNVIRWNERYKAVADELSQSAKIELARRPESESIVGSSIQFSVPGLGVKDCRAVVDLAKEHGVELKWFGGQEPSGFTSMHSSWRYIASQDLPKTDAILAKLFDMRIPLTFSVDDCILIGQIIRAIVDEDMKCGLFS